MPGGSFHAPGFVGTNPNGHLNFSFGRSQRVEHHRFFPNAFFLGEPWIADYPQVSGVESPQIVVVQPPAAALESKEESRPVTSLLIELQGDHYVRYEGTAPGASAGAVARSGYASGLRADSRKSELKASVEESPAVLVFRDGRREEAANYAIFGGAIYIDSNYWTSGAWTRKIQLGELDLPATLKLNQERGVKFILPAGPNEVVTRP